VFHRLDVFALRKVKSTAAIRWQRRAVKVHRKGVLVRDVASAAIAFSSRHLVDDTFDGHALAFESSTPGAQVIAAAVRSALSRGFRLYMQLLIGVDFALEGTYLFPVTLARDEIGLDQVAADTFFFSFELIARALQGGHSVADAVISSRPRTDGGASRVANAGRIRRVAAEVLTLRTRLRQERDQA